MTSHTKVLSSGTSVEVAPFSSVDLPAIFSIEQAASVHPWSLKNFEDSLASQHLCLGVKLAGEWVAVVVVQHKVVDAEVLILAVHPKAQRRGIAKSLLEVVIDKYLVAAERLFLEVRASNDPAIALYEELGFNCMGERKNYYPSAKGREDALIYGLELQL